MSLSKWIRVKKGVPCSICGKSDWCEVSADGEVALCMRVESDKPSHNGGWIHRLKVQQYSSVPIKSTPYKLHEKAPDDILDKVYRTFLDLLPLSASHRTHLANRGLDDRQIERHGYKSLPGVGRSEIAKSLIELFGLDTMDTVPGFMVSNNGGEPYPTFAGNAGLLIPIQNSQRQTVGLQIRIDNSNNGARYKWFSSANRQNGTGSGTPAHVAQPQEKKGERVWITEGALKANIATDCLGETVIGIAGVGNWQSGKALDILAELEAPTVVVAYDADIVEKAEVRLQRNNLAKACFQAGHEVLLASWALDNGKGIDDLLMAGKTPLIEPFIEDASPKEFVESKESILAKIFEDSELSETMVPPEWLLTEKGISQLKYKPNGEFLEVNVTHYPIIITATARDIDEGNEYLTLKYKKAGKIYTLTADRKTVSEQRSITQLAEKGFPVDSVNAKQIIQYLRDFEAINIFRLKKSSIAHGFGHKYDSNGKPIFYLPDKTYGSNEAITFYGKGPGDSEFFRALQPKGDLQAWIEIIKNYCVPYPRVMFEIYAGFAAPLLEVFGCSQSFAIHSCALRSSGKTTLSQIVASICGNPAKLLRQWKHITEVGAEQAAGLCNGIPLFLEDSQNADEKKIATMIYLIANGIGKARGYKLGGLQKTLSWLTILFSTGEQKLFDVTKKGGAEARTISFWGSPFGSGSENNKEMGKKVRELKRLVQQNYGTAIRAFLDHIYSLNPDDLKRYYDQAYQFVESRMVNVGEVHRHIDYFACILAAGILAEEVLHLEKDPHEICQLILELFEQEGTADVVTEAMEDVVSWMNSNDNLYDLSGRPTQEKEEEHGARHGVKNPGEYIAILPHILKEFLVKQGYSSSVVLKTWKERGWIQCEERNCTYPVSFRGRYVRMIRIPWKVYASQS